MARTADTDGDHHDLGTDRRAACERGDPLQPTMERHEVVGVVDVADAQQCQTAAQPEDDSESRTSRPRRSGEQAEREDEVHQRRGHDRGQPGAELEPVAAPVDPAPVHAHPVLVDLPAVAGETDPGGGEVEDQRHHARATAHRHEHDLGQVPMTSSAAPTSPRRAPTAGATERGTDDVGGGRQPPPLGSSPLTERSDAREHRLASGRPGRADGTHRRPPPCRRPAEGRATAQALSSGASRWAEGSGQVPPRSRRRRRRRAGPDRGWRGPGPIPAARRSSSARRERSGPVRRPAGAEGSQRRATEVVTGIGGRLPEQVGHLGPGRGGALSDDRAGRAVDQDEVGIGRDRVVVVGLRRTAGS